MIAPLTGRKVFAITASAFGVVIGVNILLAVLAVGTFPGLDVPNSYVASQNFDRERLAQEKLGWTLTPAYHKGELRLSFRDRAGQPVEVERLSALVGRPTMARDDITPAFTREGGDFVAAADLAPGKWMIMLEAYAADGTRFHQRLDLHIAG